MQYISRLSACYPNVGGYVELVRSNECCCGLWMFCLFVSFCVKHYWKCVSNLSVFIILWCRQDRCSLFMANENVFIGWGALGAGEWRQFGWLMSVAATTPHEFVITGDFSIHWMHPVSRISPQVWVRVSVRIFHRGLFLDMAIWCVETLHRTNRPWILSIDGQKARKKLR